MSELPPGSVNLEDGAPPAPPVPAPPAAAAPAAPAPPAAPPPPDDGSVDVDGERMVPVAAIVAERRQRQELARTVEGLTQQLQAQAPLVAVLQANPQLLAPRPAEPAAPAAPVVDPDATEAARIMDFYTAEGKPDSARGAQWLALQDRRTGRIATQAVQPLQLSAHQAKSAENFQRALRTPNAAGQTPKEHILRQMWQTFPASDTADDRVAALLAVQAVGAETFMGPPAPLPPAREPIVTEAAGGAPRASSRLSEIEQRVLENTGRSAADWQKHTANFQKGRPNVLEE